MESGVAVDISGGGFAPLWDLFLQRDGVLGEEERCTKKERVSFPRSFLRLLKYKGI